METTAIGAAFRLADIRTDNLTPEIVKEYRDMPPSPVERDINPAHVKHLRDRVSNGRSVAFHWATAEVEGKPGLIRINGQHSSESLAQLDGNMPEGLKVVREHYVCRDDDGLAVLFQQFDARFSTRSSGDVAGVYQALQPELREIFKPYAKLAIDGYAWYQRFVEKVLDAPAGDEVYSLFRTTRLHPFVKWIGQTLSSKTRELQPKGVLAAMYGTFDLTETRARQFWEDVSRGGDPDDPDLPSTALDNWLRGIYEGNIEIAKMGPGNYYQGCVNAWNAHIDGKKVPTIRYEVKKNFSSIRE